jgi:hypothetical protein
MDFDSMTREELIEVIEARDGLDDRDLLMFVVQGLRYAALSDKSLKYLAHLQADREHKTTLRTQKTE